MQIFSDKKQNEGEITAHMRATMDELVRQWSSWPALLVCTRLSQRTGFALILD